MSDWALSGATKDQQSVTSAWDPVGRVLIDGVVLREARYVPKASGSIVEAYRADWFGSADRVGQVFCVHLAVAALSAWHAHADTIDRLAVVVGSATLVLYDARPDSPTFGLVNELHLLDRRPTTVIVPPRVWHGVRNSGDQPCLMLNMPDVAYRYDDPDHWRLPADSPEVPYRFPVSRPSGI